MGDVLNEEQVVPEDVTSSEENTEALSSESEENITDESTEEVVEETTEKTQEDSQTEESSYDETSQATEVTVKPTRAQRRIQQIIQEKKQLEERLAQANLSKPQFEQNEDGEFEMTPAQLNQMVQQQVQTTLQTERQVQLETQRAEAWDQDIQELMGSNPELNPESSQFNKQLNDSLIELIQITNTDEAGNPTINKLPSEIYATVNQTISAAKSAGKKEASVGLKKQAETTAVQSGTADAGDSKKYSDEELANLSQMNPKAYQELIENNLI